ncbi:hypothetical protein A3B60_00220 [Candidatus Peregrinibacteria bacterium RIFCSPLOWO2_01_FULL_39_12]|nr:MAG: hypothetical protein A3B60_00220 [Candidatus Peregrinibacteria bacterium RIFCSPLOWO2_01_FULL_39_12]OGJ43373.1 MAG: hypothetical protein A3I58_02395 [Candidatus Peregrinibacteria bacterium RIFCSPLOWO2_02_FULL_39_10]
MVIFKFTKYAKRQFLKFENDIQLRITDKLKYLKSHPDIFSILVLMKDSRFTTHRLRVGSYRLILRLNVHKKNYIEFIVVKAGDRREVYK